jgi:LPS O-antigen subunit length determinant protein (WzzB/FepE family)
MAGLSLGSQNSSAESVATLSSRAFTQKFIERHQMLPILFADDWDAQRQTWDVDDPAEIPTLWTAYNRFDKSVRAVAQDATTGLITLTIDWTDAKLASEWANALVEEVNETLRRTAMEQSGRNIDFLTKELQATGAVELRTALFGLMEVEMKKKMVASVTTEYAFKSVDPAIVPERPYWPNRLLFAALGLFSGLMIGVVVAFVRRPVVVQR